MPRLSAKHAAELDMWRRGLRYFHYRFVEHVVDDTDIVINDDRMAARIDDLLRSRLVKVDLSTAIRPTSTS